MNDGVDKSLVDNTALGTEVITEAAMLESLAAGAPDGNSDITAWANFCRSSEDLYGSKEQTALVKKIASSKTANSVLHRRHSNRRMRRHHQRINSFSRPSSNNSRCTTRMLHRRRRNLLRHRMPLWLPSHLPDMADTLLLCRPRLPQRVAIRLAGITRRQIVERECH